MEKKHDRRLVHALDIHWYPEARGTARITDETSSSKTIDARVQAPRSLWDDSYTEKSWLADAVAGPIRLLPWFKELIKKRYPKTKLTMTEYNFGGTKHISGALAQVDALGVFGREGLFMANYWGNGAGVGVLPPYIASAFALYRNYDGKGGRFGDTAVSADSQDRGKVSVFAAVDAKDRGLLTVMVINKHQRERYQSEIALSNHPCQSAKVYRLSPKDASIQPLPDARVAKQVLRFALPPLTATLFVCGAT
jgi:hypothetical protein